MTGRDYDDAERLRIDDRESDDDYSRRDSSSPPTGCVVLAVTKTISSYPTSAGQFVACETRGIMGTEVEGSAGIGTNLGDTFYAYCPTGATVPASGSEVICVNVAHRWVLDV